MVEVPDTGDVTSTAKNAGMAVGGALIGSQIGSRFGNLGMAAGGIAGALATGKGVENKTAATIFMVPLLQNVINGQALNLGGGQESAGAEVPASL